MQYKSPIPLLRYAGVNSKTIVAADLARTQKRLLVELDLAQQNSIEIEGQSLTKDDILTIFSELQDGRTLLFHQWIYESSYLLKFLQYKEPTIGDQAFDLSLTYHARFTDFQNFVSPYLVQPFSKALNQAILKRDYGKAREWLVTGYLIHSNYFDAAFAKPRNSLVAIASEIKAAKQDPARFDPANFQHINYQFIQFLNVLPEPLHPVRQAIVVNLISLSVEIQQAHLEFCDLVYIFLKDVHTDEETKKIIDNNAAIFSENLRKKEALDDDGISVFGWVKILFFIFIGIGAIRACSNGGSRQSRQNTIVNQQAFTTTGLQMLLFRNNLRNATLKQLDSVAYDSMRKVWTLSPVELSLDAWPYPAILKDLKTYRPPAQQTVNFKNKSEYDVVLLLHNKAEAYSAHLPAGDSLLSGVTSADILSVYIGKGWDRKKWFEHKSFEGRKMKLGGMFTSVDSTTLDYCNQLWVFRCQHCNTADVTFTSPVPKSFRMEQDRAYFEPSTNSGALEIFK